MSESQRGLFEDERPEQQTSNIYNPVPVTKDPGCFQKICGGCIQAENAFKDFLEFAYFKTPAGHYLERLNSILMLGSAILYVVLSSLAN